MQKHSAPRALQMLLHHAVPKKGAEKAGQAHAHAMNMKAKGPCCIEGVKTAEYSTKKERRMAIKAFKKSQKNMDAKGSDACCSKEAKSAAVIREE